MIRVERPGDPPKVLKTKGVEDRQRLCDEYDADPDAFQSGAKKLEIKSDVYGHASVKQALRAAHYDKCAFCEAKFTHVAHGDIEHFRPKAGYQQNAGDSLQRPGYYWLAYEWTNMLLSCQLCNQLGKKNLFPLVDPAKRAKSHHDDIVHEEPLLVNPAVDDPAEHLSFREEVVFPLPGSVKGEPTIEFLRLNRPELQERRRNALGELRGFVKSREVLTKAVSTLIPPVLDEVLAQIADLDAAIVESAQPQAEYAAMVRAFLKSA